MKRTRGSLKKYVESSESEDDRPLKKSPPVEEKNVNPDDSSSESDIENYLHNPEKLDFDSEFFNTKTVKEFEKIEKEIFTGVKRLSDSESDADKETNTNVLEAVSSEDHSAKSELQEKHENPSTSNLTFNQLHDYTKRIEEAKRHVEIYKAKKQAQENKMDILNLLEAGEGKTDMKYTITPADFHSSDFESCDSEQEDWEEIKHKASQENQDTSLIPAKGLQIIVDMPDVVRKKKGIDLVAAMKRRLNRIRKENQVLVHKVHLLCWIAHGNYVNSAINNTETMAMALSLLPSKQSFPSDRTDLSYLEQIVTWYKNTVRNLDKAVPNHETFDLCLQSQIKEKKAYDKKMLAVIFVVILRALGIQSRIVMSLQVEPLRPPASELHSLSTNENKDKKSKSKVQAGSSKVKQNEEKSIIGASSSSSIPAKSSSTNKQTKAGVKVNIQPPTPDKNKVDNKKPTTSAMNANLTQKQLKSRKSTSDLDTKTLPVGKSSNQELKVFEKKTRAKSAEATSTSRKTGEKKTKNNSVNDKSQVEISKTQRRSKSMSNLDSAQGSQKNKNSQNPKRSKKNSNELKPDNTKPRRRAQSTESVDSVSTTSGRLKPKKTDVPKTKNLVESSVKQTRLTSDSSRLRKRAKSTESVDSVQSNSSRRSTRSTTQAKKSKSDKQAEPNLKLSNPRNRAKSTKSGKSKISVDSNRSKSSENAKNPKVTRTRRNKIVSQVDGTNSDSDTEIILLQVDGANDQPVAKGKSKPNLKTLKEPSVSRNAKKKPTRPNLKSLAHKGNSNKEESDSDSDFEPCGGSPLKKRLEKAAPDLSKLKSIKRQTTKKADVTKDIVALVKNRISEQKRIDRSRLVKKRKPDPESDTDSDYAPEPVKKKHHESEDDFLPKTKVKRRVQVRPDLADNETGKKKKIGNDVWVEVFLEAEEKWISVDVVFGQVHCVKEIAQKATHPIAYVLAWDNNNNLKDVTQRYCLNFNTVTRKLRIDQKWWNESLKPFVGLPTARDKEEDNDLARQQLDQPLPKVISEYKDHPLYALKRHLLKFEAIYPPEPATLGFVRGEAVYSRSCVYTLHSRDIWLKQAKVVRLGEQPYKIVKARPKWDKLSNKVITDQLLEIFGPWQVEDYEPPTAENGIVPRNAFGNVDLFKPSMLPIGCVHLRLPGLNKITKRMNIDCASAIIGFDFHGGWSHPLYDGFVVCKEYEDQLICAWEIEQEELERKEQEKIDKRVYGNWKKLIRGLLIRERLKAKYDFGEPSTSSSNKKTKGPTFCTKKR